MTSTDAELVDLALHGAEDAYRQLVLRHQAAVFNLIARLVRDSGVAEELAQDAFVKAFRALRGFDPSYRFTNWLLRIAHNTAIDYLRTYRPDTLSIDADTQGQELQNALIDTRERTPLEHAELADLGHALEWAMRQLRTGYRRLIVLRYQEDQSYEEIAEALDLPIGTVKSHLHRARQELGRLLEDAGWGPDRSGPQDVQPCGGDNS